MKSHLINRIIIGLNFFLYYQRGLFLELDNFVCFLHILSNFFRVSKGINVFQKYRNVFRDVFRCFSISNMVCYVFIVIWRVKFKSLTKSLVISAIPVVEPSIPQFIFFFALILSKFNMFDSLQITCILGFKFFFKEFL